MKSVGEEERDKERLVLFLSIFYIYIIKISFLSRFSLNLLLLLKVLSISYEASSLSFLPFFHYKWEITIRRDLKRR